MQQIAHKYFIERKVPAEIVDNVFNQVYHEDWSDISIPCLPESFEDKMNVRFFIEDILHLGVVRHIEYLKDAMGKTCAFIQFAYWNDSDEVKQFRYHMEHMEYLDVYGVQLLYTSPVAANFYNDGKTEAYLSLSYYFRDLPNSSFVRMKIKNRIHHDMHQKMNQLTETLENVVKENAVLKQQMQFVMDRLFPAPSTYYTSSGEIPSASLLDTDDIQSLEDNSNAISYIDTDDDDDNSYTEFHPDEFFEDSIENVENTIMLEHAIMIKDINTIARYFLKYKKWATDQPYLGCVFKEFCEDNNISGELRTNVAAILHTMNNSFTHAKDCNVNVSVQSR